MARLTPEEEAQNEKALQDARTFETLVKLPEDFNAIVLGQTYIETLVNRLWRRQLHRQDELTGFMGFDRALDLALALGELDKEFVPVLKAFGSIRNDLAHKLNGRILDPKVRALKNAITKNKPNLPVLGPGQNFGPFLAGRETWLTSVSNTNGLKLSTNSIYVRSVMLTLYYYLLLRYRSSPAVHPDAPTAKSIFVGDFAQRLFARNEEDKKKTQSEE